MDSRILEQLWVSSERTEISLLKKKGDYISGFPCLAFGIGSSELNFPPFPTLLMPRNLLFL